ncbi:MAG: phenylalanine 4-monooxygenase [Ponticaulis sp.]|nr:phenylalanine 4-monooxygenase [Ponticaulis sp.]|tara:strand:+ start:19669 stop:20556 length:888 start_codon:yes stop_codon:yes gene_type:complete
MQTEAKTTRHRYANAPKNADFTIDQDWQSYTPEEHDRWNRLFDRQKRVLKGRACDEILSAIETLKLSDSGVPDFEKLSEKLHTLTGWRVVPVADLVPDDVFFEHLANKRFPAGAFLRSEEEFDYIEEPDVFHDVFGHVPMLANPEFAAFMQAYGEGGLKALGSGQLHNLARLYWYTVEFGLIETNDGLRIYGAGILSSPQESRFSLEDDSPNRVRFNLSRVMRTNYRIDDFQETYFVIDSFQSLLDQCYRDFDSVYDFLHTASDLEPREIAAGDDVLHYGTHSYFNAQLHETETA